MSKAHEYVANKRKDYFFKKANDFTKEYSYIFIEDLNLRTWKKLWGKKVSDIAIGEFFTILGYQGSKNNCIVHKIDRFFPSSQLCSKCGYQNKELELKDREWTCHVCKTVHDRDKNASINIAREGASSLRLDNSKTFGIESGYCLNLQSPLL